MTETVERFDHVTPFMEDIANNWFLYVVDWDDCFPVVFGDEDVTMNEGEKDEYTERMQDVSFDTGDTVYTVTNEYCFHSREDAEQVAKELHETRGLYTRVLAFRHGGSDWARAISIEENVTVNRLGYGVFVHIEKAMEPAFTLTLPQMRVLIELYACYHHELLATDIYIDTDREDLVIFEQHEDYYFKRDPKKEIGHRLDIKEHKYITVRRISPTGTMTSHDEGRAWPVSERDGYRPVLSEASSVIGHTGEDSTSPPETSPTSDNEGE